MKKSLLFYGLVLSLITGDTLACSWDTATLIHENTAENVLGFSKVKVCHLPHKELIEYSANDLLNDARDGRQSSFTLKRPVGQSDYTITGTLDLTSVTFKDSVYYLVENDNIMTLPNNSTSGIFRFYTKAVTSPCEIDNMGYRQIERYMFSKYLDKIKVNDVPISLNNKVPLNLSGSTIFATVSFIVGKKHQEGGTYFSGLNNPFAQKTCSLDVYIKFVLNPSDSPDFTRSGNYELKFTVDGSL